MTKPERPISRWESLRVLLLTSFLVIAVVPLIFALGVSSVYFENILTELQVRDLLVQAETRVHTIEEWIRGKEDTVTSLARTPGLGEAIAHFEASGQSGASDANRQLREFLEFYAEQSGYDDLFLINPSGVPVFALHDQAWLGKSLDRHTELGHIFDDARTLMETQVSGFEEDEKTHAVSAYVGTPVFHNGDIAGIVALRMNCKNLEVVANDYTGLGNTGETDLFTVKKDDLVMVTGVKGDPQAAFTRRIALTSDVFPPAHLAARGDRGHGFSTDYLGRPVLAAWRYLPTFDLGMVVKMDKDEVLNGPITARKYMIALGVFCFLGVLVLGTVLAGRVARPLAYLVKEADAIGKFYLDAKPISASHISEVDHLSSEMEDMKTSLRSFAKYVPADVVRNVLTSGREARIEGEHRTLTIYFSDIANFTAMSEKMTPEDLVTILGEYLGAMTGQILDSGGTVDKYIGDAIMAFWGAPQPKADHAIAGCRTALKNQRRLQEMRVKWKSEGRPEIFSRIGLNTGEVIVGNIGSEHRLDYTVIGDTVNLASRLEALSKYYGTSIIISEMTYAEVKGAVLARPLDWVSVKGKEKGVLIYELLGLPEDSDAASLVQVSETFTAAMDAYRTRMWEQAIGLWEQILETRPGDAPSLMMIDRCHHYQQEPPPEKWDGVWHMTTK